MSDQPKPQLKSATSGQHPAVQAYRAKLDSIDRGCDEAASELDRKLAAYLTELKTPLPEKPKKKKPRV